MNMMARKTRIAMITVVISLLVITIIGILVFLYLETDVFKTNETLFTKYLAQNFEELDNLKNNSNSTTKSLLENSKYTSKIDGQIEYIENKDTSDENKNSSVNNIKLKINVQKDNQNKYKYYDMAIQNENEKLLGVEYIKTQGKQGIRLNGIQQFVSTQNEENEILKEFNIKTIDKLTSSIDIDSIISFSEEEKQTIKNNYMNILKSNISKDKYHKQSKALITVNNKDIQTNAYYISMTLEEYNNLYVKMLQQLEKDEILLAKIDAIEEQLKEYNAEENLKDKIIEKINEKIKKIQDNNIGNDEVKITVYENNGKTVRTSIENGTDKLALDFYNEASMKITQTKMEDVVKEKTIKIEKQKKDTQINTMIEYSNSEENQEKYNITLNYEETNQNNNIQKNVELLILNDKNQANLKINDTINIVDEFENEITLNEDNVNIDELEDEQKSSISEILNENYKTQLSNVQSVANINDYKRMLQNLGIIKNDAVKLPSEGEITDTERKRFNSQFEFFASENLTSNNITELLNTATNNLGDIKVVLKDGNIEDLDADKLKSSNDSYEYKKSISEILLYIKRNSNNEEKSKNLNEYLKDENNNKYTVSIEYDNDGLTSLIRAKLQDEN